METIKDMTFGGERPLFAAHDVCLDNITITDGESGIKCCKNIVLKPGNHLEVIMKATKEEAGK